MFIFFSVLMAIFSWLLNDNFIVILMSDYVSVFYYDVCQMRDYTGNGCSPAILNGGFHYVISFIVAIVMTGNTYKDEI